MNDDKKVKPSGLIQKIIAIALLTVLSGGVMFIPAFNHFHDLDVDFLFLLKKHLAPEDTSPVDSPVAVVAIDETTYANEPFVNTPKVMWTPHFAKIQNELIKAGAKVVGWDVILSTSASTYVSDRRFDQPFLRSLAKNRRNGKVVLGKAVLNRKQIVPHKTFTWAAGGPHNLRSLNVKMTGDGIARGVPLFLSFQEEDGNIVYKPGMAMELAARYFGEKPIRNEDGSVIVGGYNAPVDKNGFLTVNYDNRKGAIPSYSFSDMYFCTEEGRSDYFKEHFKDKVVLFGLVLDIEDRKLSSNRFVMQPDMAGMPPACTKKGQRQEARKIRRTIPGVYIHATAVKNLIKKNALRLSSNFEKAFYPLFLALVIAIAAMHMPPLHSIIILLVMEAFWAFLTAVIFKNGHVLPLIDTSIAGIISYGFCLGYRFAVVNRQSGEIKRVFSLYLAPSLVDKMVKTGQKPSLGGEIRYITCFFTDLEGFSSVSERVTATELVAFLNNYFTVAGEVIDEFGGFIGGFTGDGLFAVFGAPIEDPNHALNGMKAALKMNTRVWQEKEMFEPVGGQMVATRIGVNTGDMLVGNIGSNRRYNYTVMGDAVNLSSRLEGVNKQYGTRLMASDNTVSLCGDEIIFRELDTVRVVGRKTPVVIYEPLCLKADVTKEIMALKNEYEEALQIYRSGDFVKAYDAFTTLAQKGDNAAKKAVIRMENLIYNHPGSDWEPISDLTSK